MQFSNVKARRVLRLALLVGFLIWLLQPGSKQIFPARAHAAAKASKTQIAIDDTQTVGKLPAHPFGIWLGNTGKDLPEPIYFYRTPEGQAKFSDVGAGSFYYPTDLDVWSAPRDLRTARPIIYPEWMPTNEFVTFSQQEQAEPMIAVNITLTCQQTNVSIPPSAQNVNCALSKPQLAVDWINYLKSINAPVKRVVLGGEPYAGCIYWVKGINCTNVSGMHKIALSQDDYAARAVKWAKAIKKANPEIQIGIHLQPNTFICKDSARLNPNANDVSDLDVSSAAAAEVCGGKSWDQTVLEAAGKYLDFVVVHQYFVITKAAADETTAQKMSYYQGQRDMRVAKNGLTAFPSQIRKELIDWQPAKMNVPIVVAEFNVSYLEKVSQDEMLQARQGLYTGMALGEAYLALLQPVQTSAGRLNGVNTTILLGMFAPQLTLTRMPNPLDPTSTFYLPSWYIMSMLKPVTGKAILNASVTNNPTTAVKFPALSVYAVKKGKQQWIVVFNHHTKPVKSDVVFAKAHPVSVNVTQLGQTASGFLGMNDELAPSAIMPQSSLLPSIQLGTDRIRKFAFPAHSVTVLQVQSK